MSEAFAEDDWDAADPAKAKWTLEQGVKLCRLVNRALPGAAGRHVALTGGTLYKDGPRKDVDMLFYRVRQVQEIDKSALGAILLDLGFTLGPDHGWVWKATYEGKDVDMFFPDHNDGEYVP